MEIIFHWKPVYFMDGGNSVVPGITVDVRTLSPIILLGKHVKKPNMAAPIQIDTTRIFCLLVGPSPRVLIGPALEVTGLTRTPLASLSAEAGASTSL